MKRKNKKQILSRDIIFSKINVSMIFLLEMTVMLEWFFRLLLISVLKTMLLEAINKKFVLKIQVNKCKSYNYTIFDVKVNTFFMLKQTLPIRYYKNNWLCHIWQCIILIRHGIEARLGRLHSPSPYPILIYFYLLPYTYSTGMRNLTTSSSSAGSGIPAPSPSLHWIFFLDLYISFSHVSI